MSEQEIRIIINTIAKGDGAKLTAEQWDQVTDATQNANEELRRYAEGTRRQIELQRSVAGSSVTAGSSMGFNRDNRIQANMGSDEWRRRLARAQERIGGESGGGSFDSHVAAFRTQQHNQPQQEDGGILGGLTLGKLSRFTGGIIAIGTAIRVVRGLMKEWNDSIREMMVHALGYELIGTRIESAGIKTRQWVEHTKDLNLTLAQSERRVKTVALEIAHLTELQNTQLQVQDRLAKAEMERALAANALRNAFNPIGQIQGEMAIRQQAVDRQMQLERELEQTRLRASEQEAIRSKERSDRYAAEAETIKQALPNLERKADADQLASESAAEATKRSVDEKKKELFIMQQFASGKYGPETFASLGRYNLTANRQLNEQSAEGKGVAGMINVQANAQARVKQLTESIAADEEGRIRAAQVARESKSKLGREQRRLGFAEEEVVSGDLESVKAKEAAEQQRKIIAEEERRRPSIQDAEKEAIRIRAQQQILQQSSPVNISVPGGGVGLQDRALLEAINGLASKMDTQISIWQTGSGASA